MSPITEILTGLASGLGVTAIAAGARRLIRRSRIAQHPPQHTSLEQSGTLRRYTLLRTTTADGASEQYETTRPSGTVITCRVKGRSHRFELTNIPLGDGTYALNHSTSCRATAHGNQDHRPRASLPPSWSTAAGPMRPAA